MSKYVFTDAMQHVWGGEKETAVRELIVAGLEWWDANPYALPKIKHDRDTPGTYLVLNQDGSALSDVLTTLHPELEQVMRWTALQQIYAVRALGWERYVERQQDLKKTIELLKAQKTKSKAVTDNDEVTPTQTVKRERPTLPKRSKA